MNDLIATYHEILQLVTIAIGSLRDLRELLKISGSSEEEVVQSFMKTYDLSIFAGTYRYQEENLKELQGFIYPDNVKVISDRIPYEVLERIGTGDAFVASILTGIIENWPLEKTVEFATYHAVLVHTTMGIARFCQRNLY